jgi:RNA polymerase sigma-70 factor (ECF subfamily)
MSLIPAACCDAPGTCEDNCIPRDAGPAGPDERPGTPRTAAEVFAEYGARIHGLARRMLDNEADADDVAQDVLLLVVRKLNTFRGASSFATWVHRVTVNAARRYLRDRARVKEKTWFKALDCCITDADHAFPARRETAAPDEQALQREQTEVIKTAIDQLPDLYQDLYVLSEVEGVRNAAICDRLKLTLPAVKCRLCRARRLMRRFLAAYFELGADYPAA